MLVIRWWRRCCWCGLRHNRAIWTSGYATASTSVCAKRSCPVYFRFASHWVMMSLPWLLVPDRFKFKPAVFTYRAPYDRVPPFVYIDSCIQSALCWQSAVGRPAYPSVSNRQSRVTAARSRDWRPDYVTISLHSSSFVLTLKLTDLKFNFLVKSLAFIAADSLGYHAALCLHSDTLLHTAYGQSFVSMHFKWGSFKLLWNNNNNNKRTAPIIKSNCKTVQNSSSCWEGILPADVWYRKQLGETNNGKTRRSVESRAGLDLNFTLFRNWRTWMMFFLCSRISEISLINKIQQLVRK